MEINNAIVDISMQMQAMQFAAEYSTSVAKLGMDLMEDTSTLLMNELLQVDVGCAEPQAVDMYV